VFSAALPDEKHGNEILIVEKEKIIIPVVVESFLVLVSFEHERIPDL